jgi:serine-type D-Ala-D-Ala endopeptidase (penicillin-binding protein 7)
MVPIFLAILNPYTIDSFNKLYYNKYYMNKFFITLLFFPFFVFANTNSVVYNITDNEVLTGSLDKNEVSIASISKLMTIYTVLCAEQDMDEKLIVQSKRTPTTKLSIGMRLSRRDLIELALVSSDNVAAITLAENYPGGLSYFIYSMNEHARHLHMTNTRFVEPTGLNPMNYSSVNDIVILTQVVSKFKQVQDAAQTTKEIKEKVENTKVVKKSKRKTKQETTREHTIVAHPTNKYFGHDGVITIKTGFTKAAGFCITMLVYSKDKLYNITILGAKSKKERQQFVEKSLNKIYNA